MTISTEKNVIGVILPPLKPKLQKRLSDFIKNLEILIKEGVIDNYYFGNINGDKKDELLKLDLTFGNQYVTYVASFKETIHIHAFTKEPIQNLLTMNISLEEFKKRIFRSKECLKYGLVNENKVNDIFEKFSYSPINSLEYSGFKISRVKHASEYADMVKKQDISLVLSFIHEEYRVSLEIGVQIKSSKKRQKEHQKSYGHVSSFLFKDESIDLSFARVKRLLLKVIELQKVLLTQKVAERYIVLSKHQKSLLKINMRQLYLAIHV